MKEPLRILLNGYKGRMGQAIIAVAEGEGAVIAAKKDVGDGLHDCTESYDAIIDFSYHDATLTVIQWAASRKIPVVIGTTGHTAEERESILQYTHSLPVVWSGNYSVGVNLLNYLTEKAAAVLQSGYDIELIEMHHHHKKDAPSGTAERLLEILRESRTLTPEQEQHGRKGLVGERPVNEIGVHAVRGGDIVGEHTVLFAGQGERLELTHRATDRKIFALGAVRAALWVSDKPAGLYSMQDVLGLR